MAKILNSDSNTMDAGFVVPLEAEAKPLLEQLKNKKEIFLKSRTVITGNFGKKKIGIIISGCGKIKSASATQLLIDNFPATYYVHFGTAGAISPNLKIGDIIVAQEVVEHDVVELFPKQIPPPIHLTSLNLISEIKKLRLVSTLFGRILSGDEDIIDTERKIILMNDFQGLSVDWESAGFCATCNLNTVPMIVIRGISDLAYEYTTKEYMDNQVKVVNDMIKVILVIINNL